MSASPMQAGTHPWLLGTSSHQTKTAGPGASTISTSPQFDQASIDSSQSHRQETMYLPNGKDAGIITRSTSAQFHPQPFRSVGKGFGNSSLVGTGFRVHWLPAGIPC